MQAPVAPLPLSPLSMSSNDSSFVERYGGGFGGQGGTPNDVPYSGGPYNAARPLQSSPPASQHPSASTDMSRPSFAGSSVNGNRPPSSASSIGMSSDGRMGFGKSPPGNRESSRSNLRPDGEDALQRHYFALKQYLSSHLQDEKGKIKPNRARDKLLRLSVTQFVELSTDVYDELMRREDERMQRVDNVPRFLLPKQNFHPKRNQARQKLSTLPTERFRQLATDVFFELERRIPRFAGSDGGRPRSTASNASGRSRAASRGGMRPPGAPGYGYPPGAGRGRGYPPPPGSPFGPPGGPRRPSEAGSLGRPLPKHLQSNTLVPNKGTMVEDDDLDDDEDAFGLDHVGSNLGQRPGTDNSAENAETKERLQAQETEIADLKDKLKDMEIRLAERENSGHSEAERSKWTSLREELEQKVVDFEKLNENLEQELAAYKAKSQDQDEIREEHERGLQDLRDQVESHQSENENLKAQLAAGPDTKSTRHLGDNSGESLLSEYEERIRQLEEEQASREQTSNEVREEAMTYLREMRELSRQADEAIEQEERMAAKMEQLEQDNDAWRQRYAKIKAQNKSLRASTMGLGFQPGMDSGSLVRQEGLISEGGLVRDTDVTRFQLAVDELLKVARQTSTDAMLESVKSVVVSVQSITSAVGTDGYPTPSPSPLASETNTRQAPSASKLKARVTGTANSLITATKQHAASHGLSPVALLDAAASNLTASVVELIKAVRIRPSNKTELQDLDAVDEVNSYYDDSMSPGSSKDPQSLQIPVPSSGSMPLPAGSKSPESASAQGKNGGWFGWAGKWAGDRPDDQHAHGSAGTAAATTATATGAHTRSQSSAYAEDDSDGEYDPYR